MADVKLVIPNPIEIETGAGYEFILTDPKYLEGYDYYTYRISDMHPIYTYDGDSITVLVDVGFNIFFKVKLRLWAIDTPELKGEERPLGLEVRDYLRDLIANSRNPITIRTYKDKTGKYGRYLAELFIDGINVNQHLIETGKAELYIP